MLREASMSLCVVRDVLQPLRNCRGPREVPILGRAME